MLLRPQREGAWEEGLGGQVTSCSRPAHPAPHGVSAFQTPEVGTVLNTQDREAGFRQADGTLSPWHPLRLQVRGTWPIQDTDSLSGTHGRWQSWCPAPCRMQGQHARHAHPRVTLSGGGSLTRRQEPAVPTPRAQQVTQGLCACCAEMASRARDQVLRGGNHSAPEKAAAPGSRSGAAEWAPFQASCLR